MDKSKQTEKNLMEERKKRDAALLADPRVQEAIRRGEGEIASGNFVVLTRQGRHRPNSS